MAVEWIQCEQGTPEWFRARMGIPTASEFKTLLGVKKDAKDKVTRATYMKKLAGEIISGNPMESYSNDFMQRGKDQENAARVKYAFLHDVEPVQVGFGRNGQKGCSPDSLIGNDGMLEIKTKSAHLMIDCYEKDVFPSEHAAQCQGALWVAEREWIDIACYCPGMTLFTKRAYRDEDYIRDLARAVDEFNMELAELVERVRRYGGAREAA